MRTKHKTKKVEIIAALLILFLITGFILIKSPVRNTEFGKSVNSTVINVLNGAKRFFPANMTSVKEHEILLICPNETEIHMYSLLCDKNLLVTKFRKKEWGTWNIEGWYASIDGSIPSSSLELMAGGGTDWEYVLRVKNNMDKKNFAFSGGNHGLEKLRTFKLVNAIDNSQIEFKKGKKLKLKELKIEEETSLYFDETDAAKYAEVRRTYMVSPSKITLKTDFQFTTQIFIGTSYVCMLPTSKKYGRYVLFKESGNIYSTPPEGETLTKDGFENFLGKEASTTVEIWGDARPNYRFVTFIKDGKMVNNFNNELKTFYWDFDQYGNKLYFSKYGKTEKIEKGTRWENYCEWEINVR
ncbi:MAG: hypothetical protein GX660_16835 [Clostridiaceae bacterium]|nr:hypothetical protein [Clostridiaceae bacterium]